MTKELIKKLDDIYNTLKIPPQISTYQYHYKKITAIETKKLNDEIYDDREKKEDIPKIQLLAAKVKNNIIIMNTNIGTFTMENPKNIPIHLKQKYTIEEFYNLLKTNDFNTTQSYFKNRDGYYVNDKNEFFLNHFFNAYYWYKMVTEDVKRLYLYLNYTALSYNIEVSAPTENFIPIEVVTSPNFNNYAHTQEIPPYSRYLPLIKRIQNRFENICPLENNPYLIFTIAIYTNEPKYLPYIEENLNLFKKFILEETTIYTPSGNSLRHAYQFLQKNNLIKYFTIEEQIKLYQSNPKMYYSLDKTFFAIVASQIPNKSPLVKLERNKNQSVHLRYHDYDLYDGIPVATRIQSSYEKKTFSTYFLNYSRAISKLYNLYYKSYQQNALKKQNTPNLEDFCACLFQIKNLEKIYNNSKLSWQDLKDFSKLKDYFGSFAEKALQEVQTLSRKNSLNFYNKIILLKENNIQLETFLNINHLNEENIFNFIIQNKFLYSKEKGALIKIFSDHYGHSLTMEDILILLQEMLERKLTIEEILKEKEIPKKEFEKIYSSSKENNPLLWQEISSSLNQNSKRRYLKLIHLGYKVLRTPLSSKEEYNQLFSKTISFDDLLEELKNTELYDLLLDKASTWKDFNEFATYKKLKIKNS